MFVGPNQRGSQAPQANVAVGKRRLSKHNGSSTLLAAINTSSSNLQPAQPLRPSPASSRSEGLLLSPVGGVPTSSDVRGPTSQARYGTPHDGATLSTAVAEEDHQSGSGLGLKKKMSRTGTMLGNRASFRLGRSIPQRSQSEISLADMNAESHRVMSQIKEQAVRNATQAQNHTPNHRHPIRRRSLLTPGLATRTPNDPLRKLPADGCIDPMPTRRALTSPPATAPLGRPPPSGSAAFLPPYAALATTESGLLDRLDPLDLAEGAMTPAPRASTPLEGDYGRLGAGLRIANGMASPDLSVRSGRGSASSPAAPVLAPGSASDWASGDPTSDFGARSKAPLKSRLYMIQNADLSSDEVSASPAIYSHSPSSSAVSDPSSALAQQYQLGIPSSPYESSVDLNKPLPTPPPSQEMLKVKETSTKSSTRSRSKTARPDLDYRRRESLDGDMGERQDTLIDETLFLLESIGSSHSESAKSALAPTTTDTSLQSAYSNAHPAAVVHETEPERVIAGRGTRTVPTRVTTTTTTGPITTTTTTVRTTVRAQPQIRPTYATTLTTNSTSTTTTGPISASAEHSSQGDVSQVLSRPPVNHSRSRSDMPSLESAANTSFVEPHSIRFNTVSSGKRKNEMARPALSPTTNSTPSSSFASSKLSSSSETTPTLASLRGGVSGSTSQNSRRLRKDRRASLPPAERFPVQQPQTADYSGFIPAVPQDVAARHARRAEEFPPLGRTVPQSRHTKKAPVPSANPLPASAPLPPPSSLPIRAASPQGSSQPPPAQLPPPATSQLKGRRASKSFLGRILNSQAANEQPAQLEVSTAPGKMSRGKLRASRSEQRDDLEAGDMLTDLGEVDVYYGASPYDAARTPEPRTAPGPYRRPSSERVVGMTQMQAAELNQMRMGQRFGPSIDEQVARGANDVWHYQSQSAPPWKSQFNYNPHTNPFAPPPASESHHHDHGCFQDLSEEPDLDQTPYTDDHANDSIYERYQYDEHTSDIPIYAEWQNTWAPESTLTNKPLPASPENDDIYRRASDRTRTTASSPQTPADESWTPRGSSGYRSERTGGGGHNTGYPAQDASDYGNTYVGNYAGNMYPPWESSYGYHALPTGRYEDGLGCG